MARGLTGDKPLPEPMWKKLMTQFTDTYMQLPVSMD